MQKTRMGIAVGLLGAAICFAGLFGGYLVSIILAGYVLLFEKNAWLRRTAVKVVTLMVFFSLLMTIINLIPNLLNLINNIVNIVNGSFSIPLLTKVVAALVSGIDIVEKILLMGLGFKALNQGTIVIPTIDKLISKHME